MLSGWRRSAEERALKQLGKAHDEGCSYLAEPTPPPIPLDRTCLFRYVHSSKRLAHYDQMVAGFNMKPLSSYDTDGEQFLEKARYLGVATIADLDRIIESLGDNAVRLASAAKIQGDVMRGSFLYFLFDLLACRLPTLEDHEAYYASLKRSSSDGGYAQEMRDSYAQIKEYGW